MLMKIFMLLILFACPVFSQEERVIDIPLKELCDQKEKKIKECDEPSEVNKLLTFYTKASSSCANLKVMHEAVGDKPYEITVTDQEDLVTPAILISLLTSN
jgi:hypothetical protein